MVGTCVQLMSFPCRGLSSLWLLGWSSRSYCSLLLPSWCIQAEAQHCTGSHKHFSGSCMAGMSLGLLSFSYFYQDAKKQLHTQLCSHFSSSYIKQWAPPLHFLISFKVYLMLRAGKQDVNGLELSPDRDNEKQKFSEGEMGKQMCWTHQK